MVISEGPVYGVGQTEEFDRKEVSLGYGEKIYLFDGSVGETEIMGGIYCPNITGLNESFQRQSVF